MPKNIARLVLFFWIGLILSGHARAGLSVSQTQFSAVIAKGYNHTPLFIPVTLTGGDTWVGVTATSDSSFLQATKNPLLGGVDLEFKTASLLANQVVTVTLTTPNQTIEIFVQLTLATTRPFRLIEDVSRRVLYGMHMEGINPGTIFRYNITTGSAEACTTVGSRPSDFVISDDQSELLVLCSVSKEIVILDLNTFQVKERIPLNDYQDWGQSETAGNIDIGSGGIIYYTDGAWGPTIRVFDRATRQVRQSIQFDGTAPNNTIGFMDLAVTSDRTAIVAMPQYGWSAGAHYSHIARYRINANGTLVYEGPSTTPTGLAREPFEAPALISADNSTVFLKTIAVNSANINQIKRTFPSAVWAISSNGEWAATDTGIYDTVTGNLLKTIPAVLPSGYSSNYLERKAQLITSDFLKLIYADANGAIQRIDLSDIISNQVNNGISPKQQAVVTGLSELRWNAFSTATGYRLYLGTSQAAVAAATPTSPEFLGTTAQSSWPLSQGLSDGTYYWRVDPIVAGNSYPGATFQFRINPVSPRSLTLSATAFPRQPSVETSLELTTARTDTPWSVSSNATWLTTPNTSGSGATTLALTLQTGNLPVGTHTAELSITSGPNPVRVVVTFVIEPLAITHLRTDRASNKVYAISENTSVAGATAYLLEIDASTERILRTLPVGSSVTDVAIHQRENRVYVTNWQSGGLLAVNRDSFVVDQTYAFKSFAGIGYGDGDVFRVAAGANGRLVVEEADQWIDISIYNTYTGSTLGRTYVREGGGVFDSTGRYYYHGENNSSGAEIARFDSVGDVFTKVNSIRPANISYYGSRTVVISEDDSRIFWAYAMLDAQLNFLWGSGETIYACNENGRLAFSETKIYDTSRQLAVLGMPVSTRVSAYHSGTRKLVTAVNGQIFFHTLALPISNLPAPNALSGSVSNSLQAQISWADQSLETRFELQYRIAGASDWTESGLAIAQNATTATLGALLQETTYEFRVRAVAAEVSSPWSTPLTLTTPTLPPSTPILEASYAVSADVAFLRWSTTAVHNEVQIESALVSAPDTWSLLVTLAAPSNSGSGSINAEYVDSSVAPSTGYRYRVRLLRGSLFSAYSSIGTIYTPALPAPTMPSSLVATPREAREVLLTWNDSTDETGYRVERRQGESAWSSMSTLPANTTSYLDTSVSSGQFYSYRVLATNSVGQTPSTTVEVLVARIGRLISDDFDPSIDNATWASIQGGSRIVGTTGLLDQGALWFGSQGARLASTLPVDVSYGGALIFEFRAGNSARDGVTWWENSDLGEGIVVEYSTTPGIWSQLALLDTLFPELSDWKAYRFALPSNAFGVAVSFRWRQLNNSGAGFDTWALDNVAVEGFLPPPPMAPSFITATAISARVVSITWSSTPDTTSYRVQRRTPSTPWQTVGQTGASTTFYTDQTAQPATSYSYQVIALNAAGESEPSQYAFVLTWSILQEWRFQNYGTLLETTEAADMADNGTGVPNLLRYAFNLTRDAPALTLGDGQSERGMPTVRIEGNRLKLAFLRRRDASQAGIRYIAEFSSDLRSWQAAGTIVIAEPVNEDFEYVVVQDDVLLQQGARYARVRVER